MTASPHRSILLCTTPRSGSTLLCSLLASSGVAGRPESWFRQEDHADYAADWGVQGRGFTAYLAAALRAGQGPDGLFACRLMSETRDQLLDDLRQCFGPGSAMDSDIALLTRAFGRLDFVFLERRDTIGQAVSRHLAETGGLWHRNPDGSVLESSAAMDGAPPRYDFDAIHRYRSEAETGRDDWRSWFAANAIRPIEITYEALAADPPRAAADLLTRLGLAPTGPLRAGTARLANALNTTWADRYRADLSTGA